MTKIVERFEGEYRFLSNFYPSPIAFEGVVYPTNEHYYQAMKATNNELRKTILKAKSPAEAKRLGRLLELRSDWNNIKRRIMYFGVFEKFKEPTLKRKLIETNDAILIEGNYWHDNFWGACGCAKCVGKAKQNNLGEMLMTVRMKINNDLLVDSTNKVPGV